MTRRKTTRIGRTRRKAALEVSEVNVFNEQALKFLTPNADLTEMLRAMYRTGTDYCVMLPPWNSKDYVIFTKDQLILLIERDGPNIRISDIPKLTAKGAFKPLIFSSRPAASDAGIDSDDIQVLIIEDEQAGLSSLKEALASRDPDFPAWWEAPVPFVMHRRRRTYPNPAAERMFGDVLEGLPRDLPEKDEFLVNLANLSDEEAPRSLMFRRLEGDVFTLEDCTGDAAAAADISWWAAVGKAWIAILDKGKREYRRCGKAEIEEMEEEQLAALEAESTLIPCEWEDGVLGYLCVKKRVVKKKTYEKTENARTESARTENAKTGRPKTKIDPAEVHTKARKSSRPARKRKKAGDSPAGGGAPKEEEPIENRILKVLGPQTLGLLAPGRAFSASAGAGTEQLPLSSRETRKPQTKEKPGTKEK
jgi:hypothetical protein